MDPMEQFESELAAKENHPYTPLHAQLAHNDSRMLEKLVAMRKIKGLSQDTVAARMNRSKTAVSNFERLGDDPHLSTIRRYAAAVGAKITTEVRDFDEFQVKFTDSDVVVVVPHESSRLSTPRHLQGATDDAPLDWITS